MILHVLLLEVVTLAFNVKYTVTGFCLTSSSSSLSFFFFTVGFLKINNQLIELGSFDSKDRVEHDLDEPIKYLVYNDTQTNIML